MTAVEFVPWPKIGRLNRDIVITEKIDGTNAAIGILEDGTVYAQSRTRIITPGKSTDNFGFAAWVAERAYLGDLLGAGLHYGEWWGLGIQRGYGQARKRFSLFNTARWGDARERLAEQDIEVVPVLYEGPFSQGAIDTALEGLRDGGSYATDGYANAEGIVVYHTATKTMFKVTLDGDEKPKGQAA